MCGIRLAPRALVSRRADADHVADGDDAGRRGSACRNGTRRRPSPAGGGTARRRSRRRPAGASRGRCRAPRRGRPSSPARRRRTAPANFFTCAKLVTGRMPGTIGTVMPAVRGALDEAQIDVGVEEELRDRAGGAGIDLALQIVEIGRGARRLGMGLGIGGDADLEIGDAPQPGDEIGGIGIAAGMRRDRPRARRADRRAAPRCGGCRPPSSARATSSISARAAPTQVRCAAGSSARLAGGCAAPSRGCARASSRRRHR